MVKIYQLDREFSWYVWLCPAHVKAWFSRGWQLRGRKTPPHPIPCSDCAKETA